MLDKEMGKRYFIGCWMILMGLAGWGQHSLRAQTASSGIQMPQLSYALNALAPVVSEETMNYHYGKHLKAYIDKLNVLIVGTPFEKSDLETIVKYSTGPIYDNGAQALNHMIYFNTFSPNARQQPTGALLEAIEEKWGSFENFKEEFSNAAVTLFGSGWVKMTKGNYLFFRRVTEEIRFPGDLSLYWGLMFGNMPIIWIIKTAVRSTSKIYGRS